MKINLMLFTCLLGLTFFQSCVSTSIVSNKSSDFNFKVSKLFIVINSNERMEGYFRSFKIALRNQLALREVEVNFLKLDPLSLDTDSDIVKKIEEYTPDVVLVMNPTEGRATQHQYGWGSLVTGATIDLKMFLPENEKPIWRASLKADGSLGLDDTAQNSAKKLTLKLIADNIID